MKTNVHIERLILEGLPVSIQDGPRIRAAVESELASLLRNKGLSAELRIGGMLPYSTASPLQLEKKNNPGNFGRQIARSIHGGIGESE